MPKELILFGTGDIAELAHFYFTRDTALKVAGFAVDAAYLKAPTFSGLPVVPFETIRVSHPPERYSMFIALSYSHLNAVRKEKFLRAKQLGYELVSYISSAATVLNEGRIGENCFVLEDNTIQPFVSIGNNVTLWSGNHIGHHSTIGDHTFIASHVVVSGGVQIGESCFIGVNATLRDHIQVGDLSVIGAGALILKDADAESLYIGERTLPSERKSTDLKRI